MGVGTAVGLGLQGVQAASGGKGGSAPQGGVSPEQAALAQYTYGEDLLQSRSGFAGTNTGESTMATQSSDIARNKMAQTEAQQSDVNQQNQIQAATQLQQLAQQQQNQSDQNAGFSAGSSGFGSSTNTTGNNPPPTSTG